MFCRAFRTFFFGAPIGRGVLCVMSAPFLHTIYTIATQNVCRHKNYTRKVLICLFQAVSLAAMKNKTDKTTSKVRQNVSLSPKTKMLFEKLAADAEMSMSALLTMWIKERAAIAGIVDTAPKSPPVRNVNRSRNLSTNGPKDRQV